MSGTLHEEPLSYVVLELTNRCNLRCPHCASRSGTARANELSTEAWFQVLKDLKALGTKEITLMGGEIFLHHDWLAICRRVNELELPLAIVTNGLIVNERILEQLASLELIRLGVSLDGATKETYQQTRGVDGFERVWSIIQQLQETIGNVNAITTFSQVNLEELDQLHALIEGTSVTWQVQVAHDVTERFEEGAFLTAAQYASFCRRIGEKMIEGGSDNFVSPMDDFGYFPLDPRQAPLHAGWPGCHAGVTVAGIRANGDVLGCLSLGDSFVEANLHEESLEQIWRSPDHFQQFRHKEERLKGACRICPEAERCRAGCSAMAYSATKDIGDNPYCLRRIECDEIIVAMP